MRFESAHESLVGKRRFGVSDQPITGRLEDTLSLFREANALADFVASSVTPITIAIQGDWGSGKTSLLRIIEERLDPRDDGQRRYPSGRIQVIRFETWQYAQFGGGPALPLSLLSMLDRRLSPPGVVSQASNVIKRLARPAANAALRFATAGATELNDFGQSNAGVDFADECEQLRRALSETVARKREQGIERIVVLIDDLDRVDPPLAIDILQTIKMFLDLESCVFILALDFAVVKDGVSRKFGIKDERKARAFFDKIIQLPFQVPVAKYDIGRFVMHLLENLDDPGLGSDQADALVALAEHSISFNPRAIKRVMNSLHLHKLLGAKDFDAMGRERSAAMTTLFGLLCMQARCPDAYGWLLAQPRLETAVQALRDNTPGGATERLSEVGLTDPVDLETFPVFAGKLASAVAELMGLNADAFEKVLGMTRSTSVGQQGSTYQLTTEMKKANKEAMESVLEKCRAAVPDADINFISLGGGAIALSAEVRPGVRLSLEHALTWLGLAVVAEVPAERPALAAVLPYAKLADDGTLHVWRRHVSARTSMETRRDLLADGPVEFERAWRALREDLGAA